ncbi:hypothetical protein SAMN05421748_113135 [Paractinoplanes atraurantiacus]|uniref:Uncharacterized protein n=1 Tax=Paractinoplanes atraurantiacus TaxID=1036182 RepID=A0A285IZ35_9ACTN|nr:hypothetical protein SAMN05421748_113135 [Actinoplanes atraurantiacus]
MTGDGIRYNDRAELERAEVVEGKGVTHPRYHVHYR